MAGGRAGLLAQTILYSIYFLVFWGLVRAFLGPTIFSLLSLLVPKKSIS
jgi:hypothetical protein